MDSITLDMEECDINSVSSSSSSSSDEHEKMLNEIEISRLCGNVVFVDLRGFRANFGRFICKEFCLIDSVGKIYHNFVQSSYPINRLKHFHQLKAEYQQKFGHRIPYDYGNISIVELITDTYRKLGTAKTVMVRDVFDARNLKYIFRNCIDFNDCITLSHLDFDPSSISTKLDVLPYCDFHNTVFGWSSGPCAKNIASKLRYVYAETQKKQQR